MPVMLPPGAVPRTPAPAAALFGQSASGVPQGPGGVELQPGESVLSPQPANPPGYVPQWPTQPQQYAAPQPQYQPAPPAHSPAYLPQQTLPPPQPGYQPPPGMPHYQAQAPAAPQVPTQPTPQHAPFSMPPDPAAQARAAGPYQFNDGLQLGGRVGGQSALGIPTGLPAGQQAVPLGGPPAAPAPAAGGAIPVQPPAGAAHTAGVPGTPASTALRDALVAQGYQLGYYSSDQALLDDLGQTQKNIAQLRQMARLGWEAQQQQGAQPPAQPATQAPAGSTGTPASTTAKPKPPRPEWNPNWDGMVRRDPATGRFVPADAMVNPIVADRANELAAWQRSRAEQLVNEGMTESELEAKLADQITAIKAEVRQEWAREEQAKQGQQQVEQFLAANRQVFFTLDQNGQPAVNPITGQPFLTPVGQAAFAYGNQYTQQFEQQYGVAPNPVDVIQHVQLRITADQAAGRLPAQHATPQPPQPPVTAEQRRDQLIQQAILRQQQVAAAAYAPNQAGTIATAAQQATQPQNRNLDFRQQLLQAAEAKGQLMPGYATAYR